MFRATLILLSVLFVSTYAVAEPPKQIGSIERFDPSFDQLVPQDAGIEVLAAGLEWSEGPVWAPQGKYLLFSDIPRNRIYRWKAGDGLSVFLEPSGYTGKAPFTGSEPGTNGLVLDREGRLVMCCHGDRVIKRVEKDGSITVLAAHFEGKRFNSPNDLVYHSSGDLYFTDPPYGLPKRWDDPSRELDWCGVYRLSPQGELTLLTKQLVRPNGIGFSPDEKTLYVAQSGKVQPGWTAFSVQPDGTLGKGQPFGDVRNDIGKLPGGCDGMTVDRQGRVWATGPGGVWVMDRNGKLLGRLNTGERTANCTFGDAGSTLYITADMYLCKVRTNVTGN